MILKPPEFKHNIYIGNEPKKRNYKLIFIKPKSAGFRSARTRMTVKKSPCKISCSYRQFKNIIPHAEGERYQQFFDR